MSVAYLCRIFKAYTGKTVIGYLVERRIQAAIWKLREGDEKVISIALACGFNDLAYFNRTFRRIVGPLCAKLYSPAHGIRPSFSSRTGS